MEGFQNPGVNLWDALVWKNPPKHRILPSTHVKLYEVRTTEKINSNKSTSNISIDDLWTHLTTKQLHSNTHQLWLLGHLHSHVENLLWSWNYVNLLEQLRKSEMEDLRRRWKWNIRNTVLFKSLKFSWETVTGDGLLPEFSVSCVRGLCILDSPSTGNSVFFPWLMGNSTISHDTFSKVALIIHLSTA